MISLFEEEEKKQEQKIEQTFKNQQSKTAETPKLIEQKFQELPSYYDFNCPICFNLMFEPSTLPCKHDFCLQCLDYIITRKCKLSCPMCRKKLPKGYIPRLNHKLFQMIKLKHPKQYQLQKKIIDKRAAERSGKKQIQFIFGNRYQKIDNPKMSRTAQVPNRHRWTMFVKPANPSEPANKYIRKVVYGLHPTFGVTEQQVKSQPFQMTKVGWGTFQVPITVYFHSWVKAPKLELEHYLCFEGSGKWEKCSIRIQPPGDDKKKKIFKV